MPLPSLQFAQLDMASLREQARAAIRTGVVTGAMSPDRIYSARNLASELGVSATPVREALLDLVSEGFLEPVRNRGFRVIEMTDHDLDEIYGLRLLVEVPCTVRAAAHLLADDFLELDRLAQAMQTSARAGDLMIFLDNDQRFHLKILRAIGNDRVVDLVANLRDQVRLTGLSKLAEEGVLEQTASEHIMLVKALREGTPEEIETLMIGHLRHTRGVWVGRKEE